MLSGVSWVNLTRRQVALIATHAFTIGSQLARDPAHAVLVPHVQEVKRLKSFKRRNPWPRLRNARVCSQWPRPHCT